MSFIIDLEYDDYITITKEVSKIPPTNKFKNKNFHIINVLLDKEEKKVIVTCPECPNRDFKVRVSPDLLESVESFPFELVLMHVAGDDKKHVHTLVAYIDKNLECKHSVCLTGRRVIVTPYILYNPRLLSLSTYKRMRMQKS
ncbi:MAG: hypothetical protein GF317_21695 [Candidatus Lokiarchaeota archaeon]|nr:hypothetical protein [Candidatus Lokiarchaeota archaeon]MBD3202075.1 hypothetical protein [Candidatus Lokiarchaeota archaeon]